MQEYRQFTDRLLEIYREACRVQRDGRLGDAGRAAKVGVLDDEILELCVPLWALDVPPLEEGPANDYRLIGQRSHAADAGQATVHVRDGQAGRRSRTAPANRWRARTTKRNARCARPPRPATRAERTRSTVGARRQTIIVSVLESLRVYLTTFTLKSIVAEMDRWQRAGRSCFRTMLNKLKQPAPAQSPLDKLLPIPDG